MPAGPLSAFGVAVAGDEPFVAVVGDPLFDAGHERVPEDSEMLVSAQCPQTLPRKPAKGGEAWRKLNRAPTCDFTLVMAHMSIRCAALCEAVGGGLRHS